MDDVGCGRCFKCVEGRGCIRSIRLQPSATPSRKNTVAPRQADPAWERGIPTDSRGMPQLRSDLTPMGVKEYERNRSKVEEAKRKAASSSPAA